MWKLWKFPQRNTSSAYDIFEQFNFHSKNSNTREIIRNNWSLFRKILTRDPCNYAELGAYRCKRNTAASSKPRGSTFLQNKQTNKRCNQSRYSFSFHRSVLQCKNSGRIDFLTMTAGYRFLRSPTGFPRRFSSSSCTHRLAASWPWTF